MVGHTTFTVGIASKSKIETDNEMGNNNASQGQNFTKEKKSETVDATLYYFAGRGRADQVSRVREFFMAYIFRFDGSWQLQESRLTKKWYPVETTLLISQSTSFHFDSFRW
jgi:hypothetical protein